MYQVNMCSKALAQWSGIKSNHVQSVHLDGLFCVEKKMSARGYLKKIERGVMDFSLMVGVLFESSLTGQGGTILSAPQAHHVDTVYL